jgi:hypothetical protein
MDGPFHWAWDKGDLQRLINLFCTSRLSTYTPGVLIFNRTLHLITLFSERIIEMLFYGTCNITHIIVTTIVGSEVASHQQKQQISSSLHGMPTAQVFIYFSFLLFLLPGA